MQRRLVSESASLRCGVKGDASCRAAQSAECADGRKRRVAAEGPLAGTLIGLRPAAGQQTIDWQPHSIVAPAARIRWRRLW